MTGVSDSMPGYRAGVIGLNLGREHARAYRQCPRTDLVAVCDNDRSRLEAVGDEFGVPARYTDYVQMLEQESLDLVSVCTPQALHAEMVIAAARHAPKGIVCEKAMANSMGEAEAMLAACDQAGVRLAIGHQGRHVPAFVRARELVADGAIGRPLVACVNVPEGGTLNQGSHLIDRVLYVLDDPEPLWVIGQVQRQTDRYERSEVCEDLAMGIACLAGGTRLVYDSDIGPHGQLGYRTFIFAGDQGSIVLETPLGSSGLRYGLRLLSGTHQDLELAPGDFPEVDVMLAQVEEMVAWLDGAAEHRQDAHHAVKVQAIMLGIFESARTHTLERLPLRTKRSPLELMVEEGALPVRHPGRYDIRRSAVYPQDEIAR